MLDMLLFTITALFRKLSKSAQTTLRCASLFINTKRALLRSGLRRFVDAALLTTSLHFPLLFSSFLFPTALAHTLRHPPPANRSNAITPSHHYPLHLPHPPFPPTSIHSYPCLSPFSPSPWSDTHNRPTHNSPSNTYPYPPSASCIYVILRRHCPCRECPVRSGSVWR